MADPKPLSAQLVSLIHHVELQKAGWWDRALDHLIVAVLWLKNQPLAPTQVADELAKTFRVRVHVNDVLPRLDHLHREGAVVQQVDRFRISEDEKRTLEASVKDTEDLEARVRTRFMGLIENHCPTLDPASTWSGFHRDLLTPLVFEAGARTFEIISGTLTNIENIPRFKSFMGGYPIEERERLRAGIVAFLDPKDSDVRDFVLRLLNSYFFLEAGNLRREVVDSLNQAVNPASITVLVDTNFLFSVLGLHGNPSNEAALSLMAMLKTYTPSSRSTSKWRTLLFAKLKSFFVLSPVTLEE
jgi:hypothetical protein